MLFQFFGSSIFLYFRFRLYGYRDGRFCLNFARTAQQSVLDGTNRLSSSKPCVRIVVWGQECEAAFQALKGRLMSASILIPPRDEGVVDIDTGLMICNATIMEFGEAIKNPAYRIFQTEYSGCLDISAHALCVASRGKS